MRLSGSIILAVLLAGLPVRAGVLVTRDEKNPAEARTHSGTIRVKGEQIGVEQEQGTRWFAMDHLICADFKAIGGGQTAAGHGLRGEYHFGRGFQRLMLIRNDPQIDFRWVETLPHPCLCPTGREFSVRWTGRLRPAHARGKEPYKLISTSDDGMRVWLDGKLVIDRWWDQSASDYATDVELEAGKEYELKVEYFNGPDIAISRLSWSSPSVPRQIIGPENLLLPRGAESTPKDKGLAIEAAATDGGGNFLRLMGADATGLRAEYYTDRDLRQLAFIRFDPNIDAHYYNEHPPDPMMAPEGSVRWTGMLEPRRNLNQPKPDEPEEYRFHVEAHRRVRLWVDGRMLIDKWNTEGGEFTSEPIVLTPGKKVPFKVEFSSSQGFMLCRVRWSSPNTSRDVIPPGAFSAPRDGKLGRPAVGLVYPDSDTVLVAPQQVALLATGMSPNAGVQEVEFFDRTLKIGGSVTGRPFRLVWNRPNPGVYTVRAKLSDTLGVTALSDTATVTITGRGDGSLKHPWGDFYITNNEHITMGRASMEEGRIRIEKATGTLLSNGDNDAGHFVVQPLAGDGQIIARIASLSPKDPAAMAMAGITIRQSMRNRCKQVALLAGVSPSGESGVHFIRRQETWTNPISTEKRIDVPCWVRLLRHAGRVYAYVSSDGKSWELIGTERFDVAPQVVVGVVATAESKGNPATAVFEEVRVQPGAPTLAYAERGFVTRGGTFVAADVNAIDQNLLRYERNGRAQSLPLSEVAMIVYRPLLSEHVTKIGSGTTGLLMCSGDFFEGDIKSLQGGQGGQVQVSSVLFGLRRVAIQEDVAAVVLRDVEAKKTPFLVATTDQSVYRAQRIRSQGAELIIEDASLGQVSVPLGLLSQIRVP